MPQPRGGNTTFLLRNEIVREQQGSTIKSTNRAASGRKGGWKGDSPNRGPKHGTKKWGPRKVNKKTFENVFRTGPPFQPQKKKSYFIGTVKQIPLTPVESRLAPGLSAEKKRNGGSKRNIPLPKREPMGRYDGGNRSTSRGPKHREKRANRTHNKRGPLKHLGQTKAHVLERGGNFRLEKKSPPDL